MILGGTRSVDETKALAAAMAELARPGDIVVLAGDLGAGKTAFTQGFGAELGVIERITSPTFTLVNQYREGRLGLNHLDVYRLMGPDEVLDLGLTELLDEGGVTVIEWGDTIVASLPADFCEIRIRLGAGDDDRIFEIQTVGHRWSARTKALATALATWALPRLDPLGGDQGTTRGPDGGAETSGTPGAGQEAPGDSGNSGDSGDAGASGADTGSDIDHIEDGEAGTC